MKQQTSSSMHIAEIRELVNRFDAEAIENCIQLALQEKDNPCYSAGELQEVMNVLAKANFVRSQMAQDKNLAEAIRELGNRIRAAQGEQ